MTMDEIFKTCLLYTSVFAVPGPIDAAASVGCNRLIRDGAGLAASGWDILSVYHLSLIHICPASHIPRPPAGWADAAPGR